MITSAWKCSADIPADGSVCKGPLPSIEPTSQDPPCADNLCPEGYTCSYGFGYMECCNSTIQRGSFNLLLCKRPITDSYETHFHKWLVVCSGQRMIYYKKRAIFRLNRWFYTIVQNQKNLWNFSKDNLEIKHMTVKEKSRNQLWRKGGMAIGDFCCSAVVMLDWGLLEGNNVKWQRWKKLAFSMQFAPLF